MEPVIQVDENTLPSEERLRLAVDGAQLGLWDADIASGALYWNDHCYRHFGVPVGEAMTHDRFLSLLEPADREQVELTWRRAVTSREDFQLDYPITWPDGSRHWIRAVGRVYCDGEGQPTRVSGITLSTTRQKQAEVELQALNAGLEDRIQARTAELEAEIVERREVEAQLREREERLRLITEHITECFWLRDAALNRIEYVSPAYEQIWRRPVAEVYAQPDSFLAAVLPEDLPVLQQNLAGNLLGQPYEVEYRLRWPDGPMAACAGSGTAAFRSAMPMVRCGAMPA